MGMVSRLYTAVSSFTSGRAWVGWLGTAVISTVVSTLVSYPAAYRAAYQAQVDADAVSKTQEALAARATEFSTGDGFLPVIGQYIRAVNEQSNLGAAQTALREKLAEELLRSRSLEPVFGAEIKPAIEHYQKAIELLIGVIPESKDPTSMYAWTVYVDQVLTAKDQLTSQLLAQAGLRAPNAA